MTGSNAVDLAPASLKLVEESRPRLPKKAVTGIPSLSNIAELVRHGQINERHRSTASSGQSS